MARAFLRQTMIALRARRQAYRVAADFLYDEPIDVDTFPCRSCGQPIRPIAMSESGWVRCAVCGVSNRAPPHFRTRVPARVVTDAGTLDYWENAVNDHCRRRRMMYLLLIVYAALFVTWLIFLAQPR